MSLWEELASWGYVVAGPLSCEDGCLGDCQVHKGVMAAGLLP